MNVIRTFETGATRGAEDGKLDYEGFLSPLALKEFAAYMHENRIQADGKFRDSDNWQKGIPLTAYMKSAFRHFMDLWKEHRDADPNVFILKNACCALLFNIQGYLHELCAYTSDPDPRKPGKAVGSAQDLINDETTNGPLW